MIWFSNSTRRSFGNKKPRNRISKSLYITLTFRILSICIYISLTYLLHIRKFQKGDVTWFSNSTRRSFGNEKPRNRISKSLDITLSNLTHTHQLCTPRERERERRNVLHTVWWDLTQKLGSIRQKRFPFWKRTQTSLTLMLWVWEYEIEGEQDASISLSHSYIYAIHIIYDDVFE